jgi:hypothetical protein
MISKFKDPEKNCRTWGVPGSLIHLAPGGQRKPTRGSAHLTYAESGQKTDREKQKLTKALAFVNVMTH